MEREIYPAVATKAGDEAVIDPDLEICDPHHHLWYPAPGYSLEDFQQDISDVHRVTRTVFIESRKMLRLDGPVSMQPVGETEFVSDLVTRKKPSSVTADIAAGIVGFADLTLGAEVASVLEGHLAAGGGRFKGVRYSTTWDAGSEFRCSAAEGIMSEAYFKEGFAALERYDLSFDAWLYHPQLPELADLAKTFPATWIVICHAGGPLGIGPYRDRQDDAFRDWKKAVKQLAGYDNVYMKLGGLGMDITGFGWLGSPQSPGSSEMAERFVPYFEWCIECFGVHRCMFESNFPVDKRSYSYTSFWNACKRFAASFSMSEKRALFYDTATRFYRLPR